jgi:haloalkane dehalogenase
MTRSDVDKHTITRPSWLTEEVWPFSIKSAIVDGSPISYTDEGRGPALVLVHDGMWSFLWGDVIRRLRTGFRVITLDFPGSGLTPAGVSSRVGLESDSRVLEGLIDHLGLTEMTLVVHDLGGPVGLGLATRRPGSVTALVAVNSFAWPPRVGSLRMMLRVMASSPMRWLNTSTNVIARATSSRFGVGRQLSREARRAFVAPYRDDGPSRRRFHTLMGSVRSEGQFLAGIEQALNTSLNHLPVLTVFGQRNDPFGFQPEFERIFPDTTSVVVPGGYHFPMCDDPDGFATAVIGWHEGVGR